MKEKNRWQIAWLMSAAFLTAAIPAVAGEEFVLRPKYPQVKTISTEDLARDYDKTIIVDVRSNIEFDVVHINKALHIPIAQSDFLGELEKARGKTLLTPIAFYCNGYTCAKSYKAAIEAMDAGFENVFAYDAGIYEWVVTHPDKATLMAKTPASKEKLITEEALKQRKISYEDFAKKAAEPNTVVIDVREPFQRAQNPELPQNKMLLLAGVRNIPSDRLVALLKTGEFSGQRLLITDAVGKQVQWLQYYLEEEGYRNYYFLDQGVLSAADASAVK